MTASPAPSREQIVEQVTQSLSMFQNRPVDDIRRELADGGDITVKSMHGVVVVALVGAAFGVTLPGPDKLRRNEVTSIGSLVDLVTRTLGSQQRAAS